MSRAKTEQLAVIDHLEDFAGKAVQLIANESKEGCDLFINILDTAKQHYQKTNGNWFQKTLYYYTRLRGEAVEQAIGGLKEVPDPTKRLQEFKSLVSEGEWKHGSFNYYLFREIIQIIPGYERRNEELIKENMLRLRDLMIKKIDLYIAHFNANKKTVESRALETKSSSQSVRKIGEQLLSAKESLPTPEVVKPAQRIDLNQYKKLEDCLSGRVVTRKEIQVGRINLENYAAIAGLFAHTELDNEDTAPLEESAEIQP